MQIGNDKTFRIIEKVLGIYVAKTWRQYAKLPRSRDQASAANKRHQTWRRKKEHKPYKMQSLGLSI